MADQLIDAMASSRAPLKMVKATNARSRFSEIRPRRHNFENAANNLFKGRSSTFTARLRDAAVIVGWAEIVHVGTGSAATGIPAAQPTETKNVFASHQPRIDRGFGKRLAGRQGLTDSVNPRLNLRACSK